jgi:protein SMG8
VGGAESARIADRILDAHVFSPGGSAMRLAGGVRYHRDGDRRMVFLHLTPPDEAERGGELPEMLFMSSLSAPGFLLCFCLRAHLNVAALSDL